MADPNLFRLIAGMVLVFVTIAVPVQLDGNWVTLVWIATTALLFWIGRSKGIGFYEYLSYPLALLALFSLVHDWGLGYGGIAYGNELSIKPLANIYLLTSLLFLTALGFINTIHLKNIGATPPKFAEIARYGIPGLFLAVLYLSFFLEIESYWHRSFLDSAIVFDEGESGIDTLYNHDLKNFGIVWGLNYSLAFLAALSFVNIHKIKNRALAFFTLSIGLLTCLAFLGIGLYTLSELRESYLDRGLSEYYGPSFQNISIRYVALAFFALLMVALKKLIGRPFIKADLKIPFELLMYMSILWVCSSELLHWMDFLESGQMYKLGLSILWGTYSLILIGIGIWKHKKHLRYVAIGLFALTLLKLFLYDIVSMSNLSKTVVFVSLGVLLLIISFLYNKYRNIISDEQTEANP